MAASDVMRFVGSIVSIFCNCYGHLTCIHFTCPWLGGWGNTHTQFNHPHEMLVAWKSIRPQKCYGV